MSRFCIVLLGVLLALSQGGQGRASAGPGDPDDETATGEFLAKGIQEGNQEKVLIAAQKIRAKQWQDQAVKRIREVLKHKVTPEVHTLALLALFQCNVEPPKMRPFLYEALESNESELRFTAWSIYDIIKMEEITLAGQGKEAAKQIEIIPVLGASTIGLMAWPRGQGPFLAASALFPGRTTIDALKVLEGDKGRDRFPDRFKAVIVLRDYTATAEAVPILATVFQDPNEYIKLRRIAGDILVATMSARHREEDWLLLAAVSGRFAAKAMLPDVRTVFVPWAGASAGAVVGFVLSLCVDPPLVLDPALVALQLPFLGGAIGALVEAVAQGFAILGRKVSPGQGLRNIAFMAVLGAVSLGALKLCQ